MVYRDFRFYREEVHEMEPNIQTMIYGSTLCADSRNCMSVRIKYCNGRKCL